MSRTLYWVEEYSKVSDAAKIMVEKRVRHAPVGSASRVFGVLSIRDVAKIILEAGGSWADKQVREIVSKPPIALKQADTARDAALKMKEEKTGSVLVREQESVTGIVTEKDIVRLLREARIGGRVYSTMTEDPASVGPEAKIREGLELMVKGGFRHAPIVENKRLIGIVSMRDIVSAIVLRGRSLDDKITEIMTHDPVTVDPTATLDEAVSLLVGKDVGSLPVVDSGVLKGILTERDLVYKVAAIRG